MGGKSSKSASGNELPIVMLGKGGVGKSALTLRFIDDKFLDAYNPTIEDSYQKELKVDGKKVVVEVLDTAGQEEYTELTDLYIQRGLGFVVVFSVTSRKTWEAVNDFKKRIMKATEGQKVYKNGMVPLVLVGNKADLAGERQVSTTEGQELAKQIGAQYIETSARTGENVMAVFESVIKQTLASKSS